MKQVSAGLYDDVKEHFADLLTDFQKDKWTLPTEDFEQVLYLKSGASSHLV